MANSRKRNCENLQASEQLGQRLTISNPNDDGRLFRALEFSLKKEQMPNGDIVAYFEDGNPSRVITYRDAFDNIADLLETDKWFSERKRMYSELLKNAKIESGIKLIEVIPNFAEQFEWLETSSETEESRCPFHGVKDDNDEFVNGKTIFEPHYEFNTREFKVNGFC